MKLTLYCCKCLCNKIEKFIWEDKYSNANI